MAIITTKKAPEYLRTARIKAGCANRGTATFRVPYSPETIGRHERGEVAIEPQDALIYAEGYQSPDILLRYCAECPVGRLTGRTANDRPLPFATLRLNRMIHEAQAVGKRLEEIAFDGEIEERKREDFRNSIQFLHRLEDAITDMILIGMSLGIEKTAPVGAGSGYVN